MATGFAGRGHNKPPDDKKYRLPLRRRKMSNWHKDCKVEIIYKATGTTQSPGGQQAGTPASDIRITHLPTGIMAQCGEHRSQHKNRNVCLEMIEWAMISTGFLSTPKEPAP